MLAKWFLRIFHWRKRYPPNDFSGYPKTWQGKKLLATHMDDATIGGLPK